MNNSTFGDVLELINNEQTVSDLNRFIQQENTLILSSDLKIGKLKLSYSLTNWNNNFKKYDNQDTDDSYFELNEDQSNISFDWKKMFEKYTFELNLNKSSKNTFKSDFISFNIKGNPIKNVNFEISSSVIEKSPNFNFKFYRSAYENYNWYNDNLHDEKISNINLKLSIYSIILHSEQNSFKKY